MYYKNEYNCKPCPKDQTHVHEVQSSVKIAGLIDHSHRLATVSGEAIPVGCNDHIHEVKFRTDFFMGHFHEFCGKTCGAIKVGDRHVHFLESVTTVDADHRHEFRLSTFIEDPTGK
ncbi:MAG TPA: hypothetical protein DCP51_03515 [Clostridiales bacterium]|nr:hypothetical protein [Clostridiales bacterium]